MKSILFTLRDPIGYCILEGGLPDTELKINSSKTGLPSSFPGWPSMGDALCNPSAKEFIGLSFHIPIEYYGHAKKIISGLSSSIVRQVDPVGRDLGIYSDYPDSSWMQICWFSSNPTKLVEIQTNDVIWYNCAKCSEGTSLIAFGIEDIESMTESIDESLRVPDRFPFKKIDIKF